MPNIIIIHYSEIGLKGRNKSFFLNKLKLNIEKSLKGLKYEKIKNIEGRFLIYFNGQNIDQFKQKLNQVFGIANFSFATEIDADIEKIKTQCLKQLQTKNFKTFKINARRSQKDFKLNSMQVNEQVGEHVLKSIDAKVDLTKPEIVCNIEIVINKALIFIEKYQGLGGMPVGSAGKVVCLLSSGIDSPVAAWKMMKRGAEVIYVHFHNYPYTKKESINNVKKLVDVLEKYQFSKKLYLIPFTDIQKQIVKETLPKYRIILYRRMMLRIAEQIAKKEKALGLVTGDSLGQVASQTLENMFAVSRSVEFPIYRPLISDDKQEIMNLAKKINTYDISIMPYEDCCGMFVPKQPETKAKLKNILKQEENLNIQQLKNSVKTEIAKV